METGTLNHVGQILTNASENFADEKAILWSGRDYTFGEVAKATEVAGRRMLSSGMEPKRKVALLLPNCPAFSVYYFAALLSDSVVVPINPLLSVDEVVFQVTDSESTLLVVCEEMRDTGIRVCEQVRNCRLITTPSDPLFGSAKRESIDVCGRIESQSGSNLKFEIGAFDSVDFHEQTAVILYTSGTTGVPKGAELTHGNLLHNAIYVSEKKFSCAGQTNWLAPGDVGLAVLPLSHVFGQTNLQNGCWVHGAAISYARRFQSMEIIQQIVRDKITFLPGVPTMFFELVEAAKAIEKPLKSSLLYCVCGGAAIEKKVKTEFESFFGVAVQESYGLTETSPMTSFQRIDQTLKCGSVGMPLEDVSIKVVDDDGSELPHGKRGELLVRGPNVFKGYYKRHKDTEAVLFDGWLRTGDIALVDEDGELHIVDRKKEVIIRGGYKVYPREVESVLSLLPFIREVAVVGVADDRLGEEVKAVVSLRPDRINGSHVRSMDVCDDRKAIVESVQAFCKEKLAAYKWPRIVEIIESLPKGSTGKISKKLLRSKAIAGSTSSKL